MKKQRQRKIQVILLTLLVLLYTQVAGFVLLSSWFGVAIDGLFSGGGLVFLLVAIGWVATVALAQIVYSAYKQTKKYGATLILGFSIALIPFLPTLLILVLPGTSLGVAVLALLSLLSFIPALVIIIASLTWMLRK